MAGGFKLHPEAFEEMANLEEEVIRLKGKVFDLEGELKYEIDMREKWQTRAEDLEDALRRCDMIHDESFSPILREKVARLLFEWSINDD